MVLDWRIPIGLYLRQLMKDHPRALYAPRGLIDKTRTKILEVGMKESSDKDRLLITGRVGQRLNGARPSTTSPLFSLCLAD